MSAQAMAPTSVRERGLPAVSCIAATHDRRVFLRQAIRYFDAQDYPRRELVIVDDGLDPVADLVAGRSDVTYVRVPGRWSIGAKRNEACRVSQGEVIVQWDDDDWYGPSRISRQLEDLVAGHADVTGLTMRLVLDTCAGRCWRAEAAARVMFYMETICGSLAFRRSCWHVSRYPDESIGEEAELLERMTYAGARFAPVGNVHDYVIVRHGTNTWEFDLADWGGPGAWTSVPMPSVMPVADCRFYRSRRGRCRRP